VKPSSPPARPQAHHRRGRLLLRAWAVYARAAPRFPALGQARLAQLARAAAVPFTASLTPWLHLSGPPSSFPRRRRISFHCSPESNPSPNSFPSLFSASPGYKNEVPHPSAPSYLEVKHRRRLEEAPLEPPSEPSAIPRTAPSSGQLCLHLLPW
jgi:hypothetical protein